MAYLAPTDMPPSYHKEALTSTTCADDYTDLMRAASPNPPATPRRGSRESSPTHSDYETYTPSLYNTGCTAAKTLDVYHSTSRLNLRIHSPSSPIAIYFVSHSAFTPKTPDLTLHAGPNKDGPVVGVARWSSMYSSTTHIGLGDPGEANTAAHSAVQWADMQAQSRGRFNDHVWSAPSSPHRAFKWVRTHHEGVGKEHNSWSACNFKLVDDRSGEVVATFATNRWKAWKKFGKFTFRASDMPSDVELMALLTCLALVEKHRRRARTRRNNHGGGS